MISNKGSVLVQVTVIVLVAALTTLVMLLLMNLGVFEEQPENEQVSLLNTQFIPLERGGDLQIRQIDFCKRVDTEFNCYTKTTSFVKGEDVYIRFLVETSAYQGQVLLVRNYRIVDPLGNVIQDLEQQNAYVYEEATPNQRSVAFADKLTFFADDLVGEYAIEMVVESPLLDKRVAIVKRIMIEE